MEGPTQLCKGVDYPLSLGETMQGQLADLCYMRYEFKPASAGRQGQGQVSIEGSEVRVASLISQEARQCKRASSKKSQDIPGAKARDRVLAAAHRWR